MMSTMNCAYHPSPCLCLPLASSKMELFRKWGACPAQGAGDTMLWGITLTTADLMVVVATPAPATTCNISTAFLAAGQKRSLWSFVIAIKQIPPLEHERQQWGVGIGLPAQSEIYVYVNADRSTVTCSFFDRVLQQKTGYTKQRKNSSAQQ